MNRDWVLFHLDQAAEVLTQLRDQVSSGAMDSMHEVDLGNSIAEIRGNLNAAWGGRNDASLSPERLAEISDAKFARLRAVPEDLRPI